MYKNKQLKKKSSNQSIFGLISPKKKNNEELLITNREIIEIIPKPEIDNILTPNEETNNNDVSTKFKGKIITNKIVASNNILSKNNINLEGDIIFNDSKKPANIITNNNSINFCTNSNTKQTLTIETDKNSTEIKTDTNTLSFSNNNNKLFLTNGSAYLYNGNSSEQILTNININNLPDQYIEYNKLKFNNDNGILIVSNNQISTKSINDLINFSDLIDKKETPIINIEEYVTKTELNSLLDIINKKILELPSPPPLPPIENKINLEDQIKPIITSVFESVNDAVNIQNVNIADINNQIIENDIKSKQLLEQNIEKINKDITNNILCISSLKNLSEKNEKEIKQICNSINNFKYIEQIKKSDLPELELSDLINFDKDIKYEIKKTNINELTGKLNLNNLQTFNFGNNNNLYLRSDGFWDDIKKDNYVYVNPKFDNTNDKYSTIQNALNKIPNNSIVFIYPGNYNESLFINNKQNITLQGFELYNSCPVICKSLNIVGNSNNIYFKNLQFQNNSDEYSITVNSETSIKLNNCLFISSKSICYTDIYNLVKVDIQNSSLSLISLNGLCDLFISDSNCKVINIITSSSNTISLNNSTAIQLNQQYGNLIINNTSFVDNKPLSVCNCNLVKILYSHFYNNQYSLSPININCNKYVISNSLYSEADSVFCGTKNISEYPLSTFQSNKTTSNKVLLSNSGNTNWGFINLELDDLLIGKLPLDKVEIKGIPNNNSVLKGDGTWSSLSLSDLQITGYGNNKTFLRGDGTWEEIKINVNQILTSNNNLSETFLRGDGSWQPISLQNLLNSQYIKDKKFYRSDGEWVDITINDIKSVGDKTSNSFLNGCGEFITVNVNNINTKNQPNNNLYLRGDGEWRCPFEKGLSVTDIKTNSAPHNNNYLCGSGNWELISVNSIKTSNEISNNLYLKGDGSWSLISVDSLLTKNKPNNNSYLKGDGEWKEINLDTLNLKGVPSNNKFLRGDGQWNLINLNSLSTNNTASNNTFLSGNGSWECININNLNIKGAACSETFLRGDGNWERINLESLNIKGLANKNTYLCGSGEWLELSNIPFCYELGKLTKIVDSQSTQLYVGNNLSLPQSQQDICLKNSNNLNKSTGLYIGASNISICSEDNTLINLWSEKQNNCQKIGIIKENNSSIIVKSDKTILTSIKQKKWNSTNKNYLKRILSLPIYTFIDKESTDDKIKTGLLYEDIKTIFNEKGIDSKNDGFINYQDIFCYSLLAFQQFYEEQHTKMSKIEKENEILKMQISELYSLLKSSS